MLLLALISSRQSDGVRNDSYRLARGSLRRLELFDREILPPANGMNGIDAVVHERKLECIVNSRFEHVKQRAPSVPGCRIQASKFRDTNCREPRCRRLPPRRQGYGSLDLQTHQELSQRRSCTQRHLTHHPARDVRPDSLRYVLKDLFEDITFYENKVDTVVTTKRADGQWDVHLVLSSKKLKGDSAGNTASVPVNDYIDVGIFGDHISGQKLGAPLMVKKVRITQPVTVLDFVVVKEPHKAGIDPYYKLIDRTPEDNVTDVVKKK